MLDSNLANTQIFLNTFILYVLFVSCAGRLPDLRFGRDKGLDYVPGRRGKGRGKGAGRCSSIHECIRFSAGSFVASSSMLLASGHPSVRASMFRVGMACFGGGEWGRRCLRRARNRQGCVCVRVRVRVRVCARACVCKHGALSRRRRPSRSRPHVYTWMA